MMDSLRHGIFTTKQIVLWIVVTLLIPHVSSQYYIFDPAILTPTDADALCSFSYGTTLASIHNSAQNDEAKSLCPTSGPECWTGGTDAGNEATWTWTDGTPFDYGTDIRGGLYPWSDDSNWLQPDNKDNEDCLLLWNTNRNWNDAQCTMQYASICNYPSSITVVNDANNIRQPVAGTIIGYMDVLDEVHCEFDFILYSHLAYWSNIIQIGSIGNERFPAFYIYGQNQMLQGSFTRITQYNHIEYESINLNTWYHLEYHVTQTSVLMLLDSVEIGNEINHDSHVIVMNKPIYISFLQNNNNAIDGIIRDLKISTNNAYITPFNYLCDYNNRFTVIKGNWSSDASTCWLTQHNETGEGNVVWLGDLDATSIDWEDYKIEFTVNLLRGGVGANAGLLFRAQTVGPVNNAGQQYYVDWRRDTGIRFSRMNDGWYPLYADSFTPNFNEDYLIRVEAESNNFKIYNNNALILSVSHSAYTFGSVGFRTRQAAAIFKKLRITFPDNNNWISFAPTSAPTPAPTPAPTDDPTAAPSLNPTLTPTNAPSQIPSDSPTLSPSLNPTAAPTLHPSLAPSSTPTSPPSNAPSSPPTMSPTLAPSSAPSKAPSTVPSLSPTNAPTTPAPTLEIHVITYPSLAPTLSPLMSITVSLENQDGNGGNEGNDGLATSTKLTFGFQIMVISIVIIVLCCIILLLCCFYDCFFRKKLAPNRKNRSNAGQNVLQSNSDVVVVKDGNVNVELTNYNQYNTQPQTANLMERVRSSSANSSDNVPFAIASNMMSTIGDDGGLTVSQLRIVELPLPKEDVFDEELEDDDDEMYKTSHATSGGSTTTGQ